jgi:ribulose-phosphate 3-epimerase
MSIILAPSLLAADFANLQKDIQLVNESHADWFHIDIMDGVFVPNISFGFPVLESIQKYAQKPLDVHLMIIQPERYFETFKKYGAHILTIHYEACTHLHRNIQQIKQLGMKAGVAINPHTPVNLIEDIAHEIDLLLIMSVNPGYGGQSFIKHSYKKIEQAHQLKTKYNYNFIIEVDGGVNATNASQLVQAGANALVAGSFVFHSDNPADTINKLKEV